MTAPYALAGPKIHASFTRLRATLPIQDRTDVLWARLEKEAEGDCVTANDRSNCILPSVTTANSPTAGSLSPRCPFTPRGGACRFDRPTPCRFDRPTPCRRRWRPPQRFHCLALEDEAGRLNVVARPAAISAAGGSRVGIGDSGWRSGAAGEAVSSGLVGWVTGVSKID